MHYGKVVTLGVKAIKKLSTLENDFSANFHQKHFLHEAFLTPQKSEDGKVLKKYRHAKRGKKKKTQRGCFSQTKWVPKKLF